MGDLTMPELKLVINDPQTGKSYPKTQHIDLMGRKIGDIIQGKEMGLPGFECEITGGSDTAGFPLRKGLGTSERKSVLLRGGTGLRAKRKGMKLRKTVRGGIIGNLTAQVNLKIITYGKEPLEKLLGIVPKEESHEEKK